MNKILLPYDYDLRIYKVRRTLVEFMIEGKFSFLGPDRKVDNTSPPEFVFYASDGLYRIGQNSNGFFII